MTPPPANRPQRLRAVLYRMVPQIPDFEADEVLSQAQRSPGLRRGAPESAIWLSLLAIIRHVCTEYDQLLRDGYDRESARYLVREEMNSVLLEWGCKRQISPTDDAD